jgi:hypothetical protein
MLVRALSLKLTAQHARLEAAGLQTLSAGSKSQIIGAQQQDWMRLFS